MKIQDFSKSQRGSCVNASKEGVMCGSSPSSSAGGFCSVGGGGGADEDASGLSTSIWVVCVVLFPFPLPTTGGGSGFAGTYWGGIERELPLREGSNVTFDSKPS